MILLTREQTEAAARHPDGVECRGEGTDKTYVILEAEVLRRLRDAIYKHDVYSSIAAGIADMEAGRMMTMQDAEKRIRKECGFR